MCITKEQIFNDPELKKEFAKPKKVGLITKLLINNLELLKEFGLEIKVYHKGKELKTS